MLQKIHERIQGWLAWAIVLIIAVTFSLWGVEFYFSRQGGSADTAVKVNGAKISADQVRSTYEQLWWQQQEQFGEDFFAIPDIEAQIRQQAIDQLVLMTLLRQDAHKNNFYIAKEQAEAALMQISEFHQDGQFSPQIFYQAITSMRSTPELFVQELQNGLLINQFRAGVIGSAFTLVQEIDQIISLLEQKRGFDYLIIPSEQFSQGIEPSEDAAKAYYQQHQGDYETPEEVSIAYIALSMSDMAAKQAITTDEIKAFYEANISHYQRPARWRVAHILVSLPADPNENELTQAREKLDEIEKELAQGRDFAELAAQYSDDILSAAQGGELPWFTEGTLEPEFEAGVVAMAQAGDISQPVQTGNGFEIIQLLAKEDMQQTPLTDVEQDIAQMLAQNQANTEFAELADELANITFVNADSLQPAADVLNLTIHESALFSRAGGQEGIIADPGVIQASFSDEVLGAGQNSDLIQVDPETVIVLRIKDHVPGEYMSFEMVADQIYQQLIKNEAQQRTQRLGAEILPQIQAGKPVDEVLKAHDLRWRKQVPITQQAQVAIDPTIVTLAFQLPRVNQGEISATGQALASGDYALVRLDKVSDGDLSRVSKEERRILREQMENTFGMVDYEYYVQGLMESAKIKYNM